VEFVQLEAKAEALRPQWSALLKESGGIVIDRSTSAEVLPLVKGVPRRIGEVQCMDVLHKDAQGNWWPECYYREALHEGITQAAEDLDTSAVAYITGEGSLMRVAMSVLVQLGYRTINLVLENPDELTALSDTFKRLFFDTEINFLRNTDLTLQKNDGTILVNTMDLAQHKELSDDLTYLNFIYGVGLVVDTQGEQLTNPVIEEAKHVGLRVLGGDHLQAVADHRVLKSILPTLTISLPQYHQKWREFIQQSSVPSTAKPAEGPVTKEDT